jgi:uncharacterized membrane protein
MGNSWIIFLSIGIVALVIFWIILLRINKKSAEKEKELMNELKRNLKTERAELAIAHKNLDNILYELKEIESMIKKVSTNTIVTAKAVTDNAGFTKVTSDTARQIYHDSRFTD